MLCDATPSHCPPLQVTSVGDMVTITGLLPAHEYHYCLQAVNAVGVGRWGVAASFSTPPSSPSQVGMFKVVGRTTCTVTVAWATPADNGNLISSYHIECGNRTISVEGTQTEVTVGHLSPDTAYRSACPRRAGVCRVHWLCRLVQGPVPSREQSGQGSTEVSCAVGGGMGWGVCTHYHATLHYRVASNTEQWAWCRSCLQCLTFTYPTLHTLFAGALNAVIRCIPTHTCVLQYLHTCSYTK